MPVRMKLFLEFQQLQQTTFESIHACL